MLVAPHLNVGYVTAGVITLPTGLGTPGLNNLGLLSAPLLTGGLLMFGSIGLARMLHMLEVVGVCACLWVFASVAICLLACKSRLSVMTPRSSSSSMKARRGCPRISGILAL